MSEEGGPRLTPKRGVLNFKRNGSHPDVFKDKMQGLRQSNTSYLF